jgi:hypothetical protein
MYRLMWAYCARWANIHVAFKVGVSDLISIELVLLYQLLTCVEIQDLESNCCWFEYVL